MFKIIYRLVVLLLILISATVFGQKGTQSPYSSFGLGELNSSGYAAFESMGGVSMGNTDSTIINTNNPASYSYFNRHKPVFQIGLEGKFSEFSTTANQTNQRYFGLNHFQLGLPIKKNWGAAVGIKPYSFTGYTITNYMQSEAGDTTQQVITEGQGGIRIANFGLAFKPLNFSKNSYVLKHTSQLDTLVEMSSLKDTIKGVSKQTLSLGFNVNYLFGTTKQIRSSEYLPSTSTIFNARAENGLRLSGASVEFGLNYQFGFYSPKISRSFSFGATYVPASNVRAYQDIFAYSYVGSFYKGETTTIIDTIEFVDNDQGTVLKPEAYKVGFEYRNGPRGSNQSLLRIGADLNFEKWSSFSTKFRGLENNAGLKDRLSLGLGIEWTPYSKSQALGNNITPFLGKLNYRIGFNYAQTELLVKNNLNENVGITDYGMSFGLGLPISINNASTNINFGANLGNLGTTENGLIKERYIGLFFGLSITPGNGDFWFVKRKYD